MRCVWQASRTKAKHHEYRLCRRGGARRGLVGRYPGAGGEWKVAAGDRLDHALRRLAATPYARYARTVGGLPEAQRAVTATLLWHLRVVAGPAAPGRCPPARSAGRRIRDRQHCLPAARTGRSSRREPAAVPARGAGDCLAEPAAHRRTSRAPRSGSPRPAGWCPARPTGRSGRLRPRHSLATALRPRSRIPRLRRELAAMELALEGAEHEEAVRRRWGAAHGAR